MKTDSIRALMMLARQRAWHLFKPVELLVKW